jgi:YggT family protein
MRKLCGDGDQRRLNPGCEFTRCRRGASRDKNMYSIFQILMLLVEVVWFFVIANVILNWLVNFQVLNTRQPLVYQIWNGTNAIVEPILRPIRRLVSRVIPNIGGIDISPLIVILILAGIRIVLRNNAAAFY